MLMMPYNIALTNRYLFWSAIYHTRGAEGIAKCKGCVKSNQTSWVKVLETLVPGGRDEWKLLNSRQRTKREL